MNAKAKGRGAASKPVSLYGTIRSQKQEAARHARPHFAFIPFFLFSFVCVAIRHVLMPIAAQTKRHGAQHTHKSSLSSHSYSISSQGPPTLPERTLLTDPRPAKKHFVIDSTKTQTAATHRMCVYVCGVCRRAFVFHLVSYRPNSLRPFCTRSSSLSSLLLSFPFCVPCVAVGAFEPISKKENK
jgi:hypothetical protein